MIIGRNKLSSDLRCKPSTVYKRLKWLSSRNIIGMKSNNKMTIVTLLNWDAYNGEVTVKYHESNSKVAAKYHQSSTKNTLKELKNEKNEKNIYADDVTLTEIEYDKLIKDFGKEYVGRAFEILSNYKGSNGKKYKSDYKAILSWVMDKVKKENPKEEDLFALIRGEQ